MNMYESYVNDVRDYLGSKFPNETITTILEATEYIVSRTLRLVATEVNKRDHEWKASMKLR